MNLGVIREFLAIEKYRSFSRAADELYLSQPSLSKHLKALENELGVKLIERSSTKIWITPAGEKFLLFAQKVEDHYNEMREQLSQFDANITSPIKVGSVPILSISDITSYFVYFQAEYPSFQVEFCIREQKGLIHQLLEGELDYVIARIDHLSLDRFDCIPIMEDRMMFLCNPNHELASRDVISIKELEDQPLVSLNSDSEIYHILIRECKKFGFTPVIAFCTSNHLHLLKMVSYGLGVALLPEKLIEHTEDSSFKVIPLGEEVLTEVGFVKVKEREHNYCANKLWNFMKKAVQV